MKRTVKRVIAGVLILAALAITGTAVFMLIPLRNTMPMADLSSDTVTIYSENGVYTLDGPGTDSALIFYPGARVEYSAYCALLTEVASAGIDCFIVRMPGNMAILNKNAADDLDLSAYTHVYIGGHSMGAAMAGDYAAANCDRIEGVIFLGARPHKDLSDSGLRTLCVVGTEDGLVSPDEVRESAVRLPADASIIVIEGGNHAQYGTYGHQRGDGTALCSPEEQRAETAQAVVAFMTDARA